MITQLIDKTDNVEVVRDQIASILAAETVSQQAKATTAGKDPSKWKFQVFKERTSPWHDWMLAPGTPEHPAIPAPIVNVWFDRDDFDGRASNTVETQKTTATFNVDCYGYGIARKVQPTGHMPADLVASIEAQRTARLVRNILMAGTYTYLGFPRARSGQEQVVWKRWLASRTSLRVGDESYGAVQHITAVRLAFAVDFTESSPQVEGQPIESVVVTFKRDTAENGQVLATAEYAFPPAP